MEEILELLKLSCNSFYLGKDQEGWTHFTKLIDKIDYYQPTEELIISEKKVLNQFVFKFDQLMELKKQNNFTMIADILLETYNQLKRIRS